MVGVISRRGMSVKMNGYVYFPGTPAVQFDVADCEAVRATAGLDVRARISFPDPYFTEDPPFRPRQLCSKVSDDPMYEPGEGVEWNFGIGTYGTVANPETEISIWFRTDLFQGGYASTDYMEGFFDFTEPFWVRAVRQDAGAFDGYVDFYWSTERHDGNWTRLGATIIGEPNPILLANPVPAPFEIGNQFENTYIYPFVGRMYALEVMDVIPFGNPVLAFDADFTAITKKDKRRGWMYDRVGHEKIDMSCPGWTALFHPYMGYRGDSLQEHMISEHGPFASTELVGMLNEANGTRGVELERARAVYLDLWNTGYNPGGP